VLGVLVDRGAAIGAACEVAERLITVQRAGLGVGDVARISAPPGDAPKW
jgi:hypothetical protein